MKRNQHIPAPAQGSPGWALITGSSSGIGAAFSRLLAESGWNLIIHGRRTEKLQALAADLRNQHGCEIDIVTGDLTETDVCQRCIDAGKLRDIDIIINNAGFGTAKPFLEDEVEVQLGMLEVHCETVIRICHAFLPDFIEADRGWIVNVSSIAGEQRIPKSAMYSATKSFLTVFTESLALEMLERKSAVRIQALLPGFTRTGFHDKLPQWEREKRNKGIVRWQSAGEVATHSLKLLFGRRQRILVIPGFFNPAIAALPRLLPRAVYYRLARMVSR